MASREERYAGLTRHNLGATADQFILLFAIFAGAAGIIMCKFLWPPEWTPGQTRSASEGAPDGWVTHFPTIIAAAWTVFVIPAYALIARNLRGRIIEPETIGDNCYYIGFLFTLTSLAITLIKLGSAGTGSDTDILENVISGFGVALVSTIVGVLMRVLFFQQRADLVARERETALELQKAVREFRANLQNSTASLKRFSIESIQLAQERDQKIVKSAEQATRQQFDAITAMQSELQAAISTSQQALVASSTELMSKFGTELKRSVEQIPAEIGEGVQQALNAQFATLGEPLDRLGSAIDEIGTRNLASTDSHLQQLTELDARLRKLTQSFEELQSAHGDHSRSLMEANADTSKQMTESVNRLSTASGDVITHVQSIIDAIKSVDASERLSQAARQLEAAHIRISRVAVLAEKIGQRFERDAGEAEALIDSLRSRYLLLAGTDETHGDQQKFDELLAAANQAIDSLKSAAAPMQDLSRIMQKESRDTGSRVTGIIDKLGASSTAGGDYDQLEEEFGIAVELASKPHLGQRLLRWVRRQF